MLLPFAEFRAEPHRRRCAAAADRVGGPAARRGCSLGAACARRSRLPSRRADGAGRPSSSAAVAAFGLLAVRDRGRCGARLMPAGDTPARVSVGARGVDRACGHRRSCGSRARARRGSRWATLRGGGRGGRGCSSAAGVVGGLGQLSLVDEYRNQSDTLLAACRAATSCCRVGGVGLGALIGVPLGILPRESGAGALGGDSGGQHHPDGAVAGALRPADRAARGARPAQHRHRCRRSSRSRCTRCCRSCATPTSASPASIRRSSTPGAAWA